jgi:hypothetical protein
MFISAIDSLGFPINFTVSFPRLALRGPGINVDASGSQHAIILNNSEVITTNGVTLNNTTGDMIKTENLELTVVHSPPSFTPGVAVFLRYCRSALSE